VKSWKMRRTSSAVKSIDVVAGLIFHQGRVLVCQRKLQSSSFALKWEFPGGKMEPGEEPESALRRELKEELDIEVGLVNEISRHEHCYPEIVKVNLKFFRVADYSGEVKNLVFQQIKWVPVSELLQLDFLEADLPLVRKLASFESG
jgi:8-oxo-dGTP diphosphatase